MDNLVFASSRRATRCVNYIISFARLSLLTLAMATAWNPTVARATPYASAVSNNAGTVSFILNEPAHNVTVVLNPGGTSLDLGTLNKGTHSFSLGAATTFEIVVRKIAIQTWTLISSDTNQLLQFNSPRGVAVNLNTNSPTFGRIYVANSSAGTTTSGRSAGDGLYLLNADQSDALGLSNTVSTAGIVFTSGAQQASTPWHMDVGPDNFLYIADFSTNTGTIYRTDADVSPGSGVNIFAHYGITNQSVHTTIGSSPIARGSLATGDLTVWATDGRFPGAGNNNRLFRWDINAGPLPHGIAPTALANPLITTSPDITTDLARGPDGKFYLMQNRSVGNESGVVVVDSAGTTVLWRSLTETRSISNNLTATDILRLSRAVAISPDGSKMAVIRDDMQTWVIPLINGVPDLINRALVTTHSGAPTTLGRDVCFDAAGNLYALSSGNQLLRVFSPGGASVATTGSDGTFSVAIEQFPEVSVATVEPITAESNFDPGLFQLTRTGDTSVVLTVTYQMSGLASNGVDYESLPGTVTFAPGASNAIVSVTPIDDSIAELTELVVISLLPGTNYVPSLTNTATVTIKDNEYPNVLTVTALDTNSFERFTNDTFAFRVTRFGDLGVETPVNFIVSGTAVEGEDFSPIPASIFLSQGEVTKDVTVSPVEDSDVEGDETVIVTLIAGGDYTVGIPGEAILRIRDDELAPTLVIFEDRFESDTSTNWLVRFGANNGIYDATNVFAYDYLAAGIPLAPHSAAGTGKGLFVAVNKYNSNALGSAGINLYPAGQNYAGDFALRFDMYLSVGTAGTTEHAVAGLNHSTLETNRVSQSTDTNNTTVGGDGVWVAIVTDASANRDYAAYTTTNQASSPSIIANRSASSMTGFVTSPPYAFGGSPAVNATSGKQWSMVELSQIAGVITLKVNAATVFTFTNTTGYASGAIMLGINDQFDSVGSAANFVIFDNVEVVSLAAVITITGIGFSSPGQVAIDFNSPGGGTPTDFHLQDTGNLSPPTWADDTNATITATASGYRAVTTRSGSEHYYRVRR